jgi:hypothetical protein
VAVRASDPIQAAINYLGPMTERPVFFSEQYHKNNLNLVAHEVAIEDFRDRRGDSTLSSTGFELVDHQTAVADFCSPDEVARVYIPEIRELIGALTGAGKIVVTAPVLRWSEREAHPERVNSRPGRFVHVDYSREAFHSFARSHLGADREAQRWLCGRYAAFNVWRVMSRPPQDCPLGLLDRRSTSAADVIEGDAVIDAKDRPEFRFGSSLYRANPRHRWGYFRDMTPSEAVVFLAYDSADDTLPGVPHSAFDDPSCPGDAPPRASCEIRAYAYWG